MSPIIRNFSTRFTGGRKKWTNYIVAVHEDTTTFVVVYDDVVVVLEQKLHLQYTSLIVARGMTEINWIC